MRAVAILPVVAFHGGFTFFSGGYVGVDVFFVISGYLITRILMSTLDEPHPIVSFYERRIRRILPALFFLIGFTLIAARYTLVGDEAAAFGTSVAAAALFAANIFFWTGGGYFDAAATTKPLQHTWSLAVEEQFYVGFPLLLLALRRFSSVMRVRVVAALFAASLGFGMWQTMSYPSAAFFLLPSRAWELMLGALLALGAVPVISRIAVRQASALAGFGLIAFAVLVFDEQTEFPGVAALAPAVGTALIIHAGATGHTVVSRFLSLRPLVFVGLISYSLYLWHWPLLVFARYRDTPPFTAGERAAVVGLSVVAGTFSWWFVERPFRVSSRGATPKRRTHAGRVVVTGAAMAWILGAMFSMPPVATPVSTAAGVGSTGTAVPADAAKAAYQYGLNDHLPKSCVDQKPAPRKPSGCAIGTPGPSLDFLVWGDSHAWAIAPAMDAIGRERGLSGFVASLSACPPGLGLQATDWDERPSCDVQNRAVLTLVRPQTLVFLAARWAYYGGTSPVSGEGPVWLTDGTGHKRNKTENTRLLKRGVARSIAELRRGGARIVLIGPIPEFAQSVPAIQLRNPGSAELPRALEEEHIAFAGPLVRSITSSANVPLVDPFTVLCDRAVCYGVRDGKTLYFDNDHLSKTGAALLIPLVAPFFDQ